MIARFNGNVVPFADDSTSTNRTVFGGVTQSDAIDDNLNADFKKGWEIVGLNDNPTREDFNNLFDPMQPETVGEPPLTPVTQKCYDVETQAYLPF